MKECIFCKIAQKKIKADIIYEDKRTLGFKNINPEAPVHLLFIPREHIEWKNGLDKKDLLLLSELIAAAKNIAEREGIFKACKLIFNIGKTGHIAHIHLHLLGGWKKKIPINNI